MAVSVTIVQVDLWVDEAAAAHGVPPLSAGSVVDLGPTVGDPGAFGAVFEISLAGHGAPSSRLLMKVFDPDALGGLHMFVDTVARTSHVVERMSASCGSGWTSRWMACPVVMGWCDGPDGRRPFSIMTDLRASGFETLTFDQMEARRYRQIPIERRCRVAANLAERMSEFHGARLVHTDLNPENVMIRESDGAVQIIDLDTVLPLDATFAPATAGKADEFMPPEVRGGATGETHLELFDERAERWSVGILLGYFLFGASPLFFLRSMAASVVDAYASAPGVWPQLEARSPLANQANARAYQEWVATTVAVLPHPIVDAFDRFRRAGSDGSRRPTALEWHDACTSDAGPAEIIEFSVDAEVVPIGASVTLLWSTDRASSVELAGYGTFPPNGTLTVQVVERWQRFELTARSPFGSSTAFSPEVHGVRVPDIRFIPMPSFSSIAIAASVPSPRAPSVLGSAVDAPQGLARAIDATVATARVVHPSPLPRVPRLFGDAPRTSPGARVPRGVLTEFGMAARTRLRGSRRKDSS